MAPSVIQALMKFMTLLLLSIFYHSRQHTKASPHIIHRQRHKDKLAKKTKNEITEPESTLEAENTMVDTVERSNS